ncbi:hypothetical protein [Kineococcus sp. SYSU DK005]|uniref:hypothetical protein n=1 Tax=Kineococcus sp. SYSU DK005 TaxID=3383126 RepID=UPI003D7D70E2
MLGARGSRGMAMAMTDRTSTSTVPGLPELPRREPYRTWPGTLAVLAVIVAYLATTITIDAQIDEPLRPVPAGERLQVAPGLSVVPDAGWYLDSAGSSQDEDSAQVLLVAAGAQLNIAATLWSGTTGEFVQRTQGIESEIAGARLLGDDAAFSTTELSGVTYSLITATSQARVWIAVDEQADRAVQLTGSATSEVFTQALQDMQEMLASIRVQDAQGDPGGPGDPGAWGSSEARGARGVGAVA